MDDATERRFDKLLSLEKKVQAYQVRALQLGRLHRALWAARVETAINQQIAVIVQANTARLSDV